MNIVYSGKNFVNNYGGFLPSLGLFAASIATEVATSNPRFSLITGAVSTAISLHGLVDTMKKLWNKLQNQKESVVENKKLLAQGSLYLLTFSFGVYQLMNYEQEQSSAINELTLNVDELKTNINKTLELLHEKSTLLETSINEGTSCKTAMDSLEASLGTTKEQLNETKNFLEVSSNTYENILDTLRTWTKSAKLALDYATASEQIKTDYKKILDDIKDEGCKENAKFYLDLAYGTQKNAEAYVNRAEAFLSASQCIQEKKSHDLCYNLLPKDIKLLNCTLEGCKERTP